MKNDVQDRPGTVLPADNDRSTSNHAVQLLVDAFRLCESLVPKEDHKDLFESLAVLITTDDQEEKDSAEVTIREILSSSNGTVIDWPAPTDTDRQQIGSWLKFVSDAVKLERKAAGLNQKQLAEKSGLQQPHISRIERGKISPTRKTLEVIAIALGISVSKLDPSAEERD